MVRENRGFFFSASHTFHRQNRERTASGSTDPSPSSPKSRSPKLEIGQARKIKLLSEFDLPQHNKVRSHLASTSGLEASDFETPARETEAEWPRLPSLRKGRGSLFLHSNGQQLHFLLRVSRRMNLQRQTECVGTALPEGRYFEVERQIEIPCTYNVLV